MKTLIRNLLIIVFPLLIQSNVLYSQQQDTTSYFPLGLWGMWIDKDQAPYKPGLSVNWTTEVNNWSSIRANYMVYWIPDTLEEEIMNRTEALGYKLDISRWAAHGIVYGKIDSSLRTWIIDAGTPLTDTWKSQVNNKIAGIKQLFGTRQGFYSYFLLHEADLLVNNDTLTWPALGYAIDRIAQVDPQHKSYVVHWGSRGNPPFPYSITLSQFAQRFPNLGVYEVDDYVFQANFSSTYIDQQARLDVLLTTYNDCMQAFRNGKTEWHAVIQAQREYDNSTANMRNRRPNLQELSAQAYLAISRGARGITAFVYGSSPVPPPSLSSPAYGDANYLLSSNNATAANITYYQGLVDPNRNPYSALLDNDPAHIHGFDNLSALYDELKPIGPILRKLKNYEAFQNNVIPTNNSAGIYGVSGDKIEIGTFKRVDQGTDSTSYFMLVNRVCNNAGGTLSNPQAVTVTLNRALGNWKIQEVVSGISWTILHNGSFTDTLAPGKGKLYKITLAPPSAPVLASPSNSATGVSTTLTLNWNASPGATSYVIQVATDPTFSTLVVSQAVYSGTSYNLGGLANGTTYYWHVSANNTAGASQFSPTWNFTTVLAPPPAPTLASPANGATNVPISPTLSWNASPGATSYTVQWGTGSATTTGTSYAVSGLSYSTTYSWSVTATNAGGSNTSATWSFITIPPPPSAPTLVSPVNNATGVSTAPTLSWNVSPGATSYTVQWGTGSATTTGTSYAVSGLSYSTTYSWSVTATNAGGSNTSATWSFTTVPLQYYLTVNSPCGLPTSGSGWYDAGTTATACVTSTTVSGGAGIQYVFTNWSGDATGTATCVSVLMNGPKTATANCKTQYYLTMNTTTGGTVNPSSSWFDAGQNVGISGSQQSGYLFNRWEGSGTGSYSGTSLYSNVIMNGPITETAYFNIGNHIINASAGAGGYISPSGSVSVPHGGNQTFNIYANPCYTVSNVVVNGFSYGAIWSYTFYNVTAEGFNISASFTPVSQAGPPSYVSASWGLFERIEVSWDFLSGTCNASYFNVYRSPSGWGAWELAGSVSANGSWFMVDYPSLSYQYWDYYITSVDLLGRESSPSPIATGYMDTY